MKKHNVFRLCITMLLLTVFCVGCSDGKHFTITNPGYKHSNRTAAEIELFMDNEKPGKPYLPVGTITAYDVWTGNDEKSVKLLREKAAEVGLDGIYNVRMAPPGTVGAGWFSGIGFVYKNK